MMMRRIVTLVGFVLLVQTSGSGQEPESRTSSRKQEAAPLGDSIGSGTVSAAPIPLSLADAIQRGLKWNFAILAGSQQERLAQSERLRDLAALRPRIDGRLMGAQQQNNLAAFGFSGLPGISQIVGPFPIVDARAALSQPIVDMKRTHDLRESIENEKAVAFSNQNTRELVVLTVTDLYFQAVSGASRVLAVEAQVARAEALHSNAAELKKAGIAPGIDVVRAEVELQGERQRLIRARNDFARQKLRLARAIGIPLAQDLTLVSGLPGGAEESISMESIAMETMLDSAYANRADVKTASARVRAAEEAVKSARSENLPTVRLDADYGAIGRAPGNSHGTYSIAGSVNFPIFNSKAQSITLEKQALLDERRLELDILRRRIEYEVRSAQLEIQSADEQLKVARSALALVRQQLDQAQDRFAAGVANNLEVVQAQSALALADENLISGLYEFNLARARLAGAMGIAEQSIQEFLGGSARP